MVESLGDGEWSETIQVEVLEAAETIWVEVLGGRGETIQVEVSGGGGWGETI